MNGTRKPILVTGSHRSGTTWVGQMLAAAPRTKYIHEPFNLDFKSGVIACPFASWFQYVCEENANQYKDVLYKIITYEYPLGSKLAEARTLKSLAIIARDQGRFLLHRVRNDIPIVKDPIAIFSASWLAETFDMRVLVMIRHPAAFCSSLKIKDWKFNFNNFLEQPLLMKVCLGKFEQEIRDYAANEQDIVSQAILLWNCIHNSIHLYQEKYPEWLFVRHEDLSIDPVTQFKSIYESFRLEFTEKAKLNILNSTGTHNPTEQQSGNEFIRNSKENIYNWKKRLTQAEIERIQEKTYEVSRLFYTENEW